MLGPQDVGYRVVVRRFVGLRDDRPLFTDLLGHLVELTETHLTIRTASSEVRVPLAQVHRAKRVPARRRPSARDVAALELAANDAWQAPVQERLGDWLLRAAQGWTGRGNSALPLGDPGLPLAAAIDAVEAWYAGHGLQPMINVPSSLNRSVGAALDARGWGARPLVLVQTATLSDMLGALPTRADLPVVDLRPTPSPEWLALAAGRKGDLPEAAWHLLTAGLQVRFAHVYADSGDLVASGRGTVTGGRWFGIFQVDVVPAAQRQGLATHLMRALATWAASAGAKDAFLQVPEDNTPATALYARLGFTTHHTYLTRLAPEATRG